MAILKTLLCGLVLIVVLGIAAQGTSAPPTSAPSTSAPRKATSAPTKSAEQKPKPDDKKKKDAGAEDAAKVTKRPTSPSAPPDPEELKAAPDKSGLVQFRFQGQPWPAVLEWLADISSMSLDWQELPDGYLNLSTRRGYRVDEVRDLINERLLPRGFTLLRQGEGLTVVKIKDLDSGMVPRIKPEELAKRDSHEFVKVSFPLQWLVAESAVAEFKPMLSPNGKLYALKTTNRLEAMDAVINLCEIHALLNAEQSDEGQQLLVKQFQLKHVGAEEAHEILLQLLGISNCTTGPIRPGNSRPG